MKAQLLIYSLIILLSGCSSSNKISNSWKNPEATEESIKFQTVAVFAMVKNPDMRRNTEEAIASQMPNTVAIPAYKLVSDEDLSDITKVKLKLKERAIEGALVLSVRNVDQKTSYYSPARLIIVLAAITITRGIICMILMFIQVRVFM